MHGNHLRRSRRVRIRDVHTTVLQTILQLLEEPNPEDALSAGIGTYGCAVLTTQLISIKGTLFPFAKRRQNTQGNTPHVRHSAPVEGATRSIGVMIMSYRVPHVYQQSVPMGHSANGGGSGPATTVLHDHCA